MKLHSPATKGALLDFTAIDFETANNYRESPCSIGMVKVKEGEIIARQHYLMRPPEGFQHFNYPNIKVHGITSAMVAAEPEFKELFPAIMEFINGDTIIAHNVGFDISVLQRSSMVSNLKLPPYSYGCTLQLSRKAFPKAPSHSLPFMVDACGYSFKNHHDALADAEGCAHILLGLARKVEAENLQQVFNRYKCRRRFVV